MHQTRRHSIFPKRITVIAITAMLLLAGAVTSAAADKPRVIGYRGGLTLSDFRGDAAEDKQVGFKPGLTVGGFYNLPLHDNVTFQPEVLITMKGAGLSYDYAVFADILEFNESATLVTIDVPLLLKFPFPTYGDTRYSLFLGPVGSVAVWGRRSGDYTSQGGVLVKNGSYGGSIGNLKTFGVGFTVGLEVRFGQLPRYSYLDIRYTGGLRSVFGDIQSIEDIPPDQLPFMQTGSGLAEEFKNGTFSITFGFGYPR